MKKNKDHAETHIKEGADGDTLVIRYTEHKALKGSCWTVSEHGRTVQNHNGEIHVHKWGE